MLYTYIYSVNIRAEKRCIWRICTSAWLQFYISTGAYEKRHIRIFQVCSGVHALWAQHAGSIWNSVHHKGSILETSNSYLQRWYLSPLRLQFPLPPPNNTRCANQQALPDSISIGSTRMSFHPINIFLKKSWKSTTPTSLQEIDTRILEDSPQNFGAASFMKWIFHGSQPWYSIPGKIWGEWKWLKIRVSISTWLFHQD